MTKMASRLKDLKRGGSGSGKGGLKCYRTGGRKITITKKKCGSCPSKGKKSSRSPSPPRRAKYGYTSNFKKGPGIFAKGRPRVTPRQLKEMQDDHHKALGEMAKEKANPGPRRSGRTRKPRKRLVEDGY